MDGRKTITYHILFSLAIVSVILGIGLLVVTTGQVRGPRVVMPLIFTVAGSLFTYFALTERWKAKMVFLGLIVGSSALLKFIATVLGASVSDYWPLYALLLGFILLPVSFVRYGKIKPSALVLSASFILLGIFFSIFSFGFSSVRFKTFISIWWPSLFIAAGLMLLLVWWLRKVVTGNQQSDPDVGGPS